MDKTNEVLSSLTVHMKYAKYLPEKNRRESWEELVERNESMHIKKYPQLENEIRENYKFVYNKQVLPSMRALQFSGKAIEVAPSRIYNCSYLPIDSIESFSETMFLLLGGTGVGYSVQKHHVDKLPEIKKPNINRKRRFLIGDSIIGWADAIKVLLKSYTGKFSSTVEFDYSDIRPKGTRLVTAGGLAPGPQPLKECIVQITGILDTKKENSKLTPLEAHDILCHIADAVLSGGIRRAAMIALFNLDDEEMLSCKSGNWWETNPQRGRSNNSAVVLRHKITEDVFKDLWNRARLSNAGEPGIFLTNDKEYGSNPCFSGQETLLTTQGYKTFEELCDIGEIQIINKNGDISNSKVWKSGYKKVIKFYDTLKNETICTPDHVWMLNDGSECKAQNLKGKRLMPFISNQFEFDDLYIKLGFIQGDGGLGRLRSAFHRGFEINIGEKDNDILELFSYVRENSSQKKWYTNEFFQLCKDLGFSSKDLPNRPLPTTFSSWEEKQQLSFLRGLWSANGGVINGARISFKSTCLELIEQLQTVLSWFDISSYYTTNKAKDNIFNNGIYRMKESYDLNIGKYEDVLQFYSKIGFVHKYKTENLRKLLIEKSPIINKIEDFGEEDVYDFVEPNTHWGVVNGYIAHNCAEVSLRPYSFCNLVEINAAAIDSQETLNTFAKVASFIATLQAGYTDFHYLREIWKRNSDKDSLIGVSMTGIASEKVMNLNFSEATNIVNVENERVAGIIGINTAARTTSIKPAGTTSLVLGSSSGIHAWHNDYYIRRLRVNKDEAIYKYLIKEFPQLIVDDYFKPNSTAIIEIPQKAPEGAILRGESALTLLERIKKVNVEWIHTGRRRGPNNNNVSATVSVKENEWNEVIQWMWNNREYYNGITVLPYDGGTYKQAPFENCTKEKYEELVQYVHNIDLTQVKEFDDNTTTHQELACSGGSCELTY